MVHQDDWASGELSFSIDYSVTGKGSDLTHFNPPHKYHASCVGADEVFGNRIALIKHFDREIESESMIAEMAVLGYRPGTVKELHALIKTYPELRIRWCIIALGSFDEYGVVQYYTGSGTECGKRRFASCEYPDGWFRFFRFLFVRNK